MTLATAITQAQSGMIFHVSAVLLILLLLYLWYGVRRDHGDYLPINRESINEWREWYKLRQKRLAEQRESNDTVFIKGKLNKSLQYLLITADLIIFLVIFYIFSPISAALDGFMSQQIKLIIFVTIFSLSMQPQLFEACKALYLVRYKQITHYPPLPKKQPYLDYTGEPITPEKIHKWQRERNLMLPIVILTWVVFWLIFTM